MDDLTLINNTSVYRNPADISPLQGPNVLQPAAVYSKVMLRTIELAESDYTFDALATERNMPSNNGANEIIFKRMLSLAAHTKPLAEGIPPASDQGRMVAIKASTNSYGRVMKFTDKVNWAVVDPLISEYTRQLSLKIPETKDILAQEALLAEAQTFYACRKKKNEDDPDIFTAADKNATIAHITRLTQDCTPTIDEFRKIVLSMEAAKVRPHSGGNFRALVSSAVMFDLITDHRVKEFMRYENTGKAYSSNMVIDLFNLEFQKAKTIKTDNTFIDADGIVQHLFTDGTYNYWSSDEVITDSSNVYAYKLATDALAGSAVTGKLTSSSTPKLADAKAAEPLNVHHSFVIGEECLFRIGVDGHTAPQFIKKELGSAGTEDPLNQRQSIGWKIDSLGYKVVNPDAVVDYMSIPTQYKINMNARPDLKNQFTDYFYGYVSEATGKYYHPEQVDQYVNSEGKIVYYVKGDPANVVKAVKMTSLVKPVNGGRIDANGKSMVVKGDTPTTKYALKSNSEVRFLENQVIKHTDGKYYIAGLAGVATAEVVKLPVYFSSTEVKADGTGTETRTAIVDRPTFNDVGDDRIDK